MPLYPISVVDCGDPGTPQNGNRNFTDTLEGSVVTYTCNTGFELVGNPTQVCELTPDGAIWNSTRPECRRMVNVIHAESVYIHNFCSCCVWKSWYTWEWKYNSDI